VSATASLNAERAAIENKIEVENARWERVQEELKEALHRARE
jgi:hypothetical protein